MGEEHALGRAGGPRRVEHGGDVLRLRLERPLPEALAPGRLGPGPLLQERVQGHHPRVVGLAVEQHGSLQRRDPVPDLPHLFQLLRVRHEHQPDLGVVQDVLDLVARQRVVDRDVGDPGAERRPVGLRPLRPVLRQDRHPRPALQPQPFQAQGDAPDPIQHLPVGDRAPVVLPGPVAHGVIAVHPFDGVEEELDQGPRRQVGRVRCVLAVGLRNRRHGVSPVAVGPRQPVSTRIETSRSGCSVCRTLQYLSRDRSMARWSFAPSVAGTPLVSYVSRTAV